MFKLWVRGGSALFAHNGNEILPNQSRAPLLQQVRRCPGFNLDHHIATSVMLFPDNLKDVPFMNYSSLVLRAKSQDITSSKIGFTMLKRWTE